MKKVINLLIFAFLATSLVSCSGQRLPDGMPPLHPTRITILQAGQPLEGATVTLVNLADLNYRWVVGAVTDARGVAQIRTHGEFLGVPEGTFRVLVHKTIRLESETRLTQEQPTDVAEARAYFARIAEEERSYDLVNLKYKRFDTSDLEITITSGTNVETFDVGEAIRQEFIPFGR